jgi:hypothetical protein
MSYYVNQGLTWSEAEHGQLLNGYNILHKDVMELAQMHSRTPGGILARLKKAGVINDTREARGYDTFLRSPQRQEIKIEHDTKIQGIKNGLAIEGNTYLIFGKYKGYTYMNVYNFNSHYCKWLLQQDDLTYDGLLFRQWIQKMNFIRTSSKFQ